MMKMAILSFIVALVVLATAEAATTTIMSIGANSNDCGAMNTIDKETEYSIVTTGDSPVTNCVFEFTAAKVEECEGLCYMFDPNTMFRSSKVRVKITLGAEEVVYDRSNINTKPVCSMEKSIKINLVQDQDYDPKITKTNPLGYRFSLDVYNKCGERGSTKSITFEEAIENIDGYHHGKDREDRERSNYVSGILLGFGLASIFLVVLLIGYCYVRNSPNRGPNRSVGMPKVGGFKKNMKPNKEQPKETEMGVRYTATGDDKPEVKPLLTEAASNPEKSKEDAHVVTVEEGN